MDLGWKGFRWSLSHLTYMAFFSEVQTRLYLKSHKRGAESRQPAPLQSAAETSVPQVRAAPGMVRLHGALALGMDVWGRTQKCGSGQVLYWVIWAKWEVLPRILCGLS